MIVLGVMLELRERREIPEALARMMGLVPGFSVNGMMIKPLGSSTVNLRPSSHTAASFTG
jgi:hypothetical protein